MRRQYFPQVELLMVLATRRHLGCPLPHLERAPAERGQLLLLPVRVRARAREHRASCASHLRQLALEFLS